MLEQVSDASGQYAYVSMWADKKVVQVDVSDPERPQGRSNLCDGHGPRGGVAFLDARWMAVANDLSDTLSLVDRTSGTVTPIPIDASQALHGSEPSTLAYDAD
jgi:hypothetical protein